MDILKTQRHYCINYPCPALKEGYSLDVYMVIICHVLLHLRKLHKIKFFVVLALINQSSTSQQRSHILCSGYINTLQRYQVWAGSINSLARHYYYIIIWHNIWQHYFIDSSLVSWHPATFIDTLESIKNVGLIIKLWRALK